MAEGADEGRDNHDDADLQDTSNDVVIKEEIEKVEPSTIDGDDDDVVIMPSEDPVVTEILDETEVLDEKTIDDLNATDDDVMIQEPKIETQLVPDDDDDDNQPNPNLSDDVSPLNFIVKIKEEPADDGYEDLVNEEDNFMEVTVIANDDMIQGECFLNQNLFLFRTKFFHILNFLPTHTRRRLHKLTQSAIPAGS